MTPVTHSRVGRFAGAVHAVVGSALLISPHQAATLAARGPGGAPPNWVIRLLGLRMVAQAGFELSRPTPQVLAASAGIDGVHAASMLPVLLSGRYRRAALVSAGVALVSATGLTLAQRPTRRR